MASRKERYLKKIQQLLAEFHKLQDRGAEEAARLAMSLSQEIETRIATAKGFSGIHLARLRRALNDAIDDFRFRYNGVSEKYLGQSFENGQNGVDQTLKSVGLQVNLPKLDPALFEIARGFSADLITRVSDDIRQRATGEILLTAAGVQSPHDTIEKLQQFIPPRKVQGRTLGAAWRAEMIMRTETGRLYQATAQARIKDHAQDIPDLMREWVTVVDGRERESHRRLNGVRKKMDEKFPVNIGPDLDYPGDPAGDPAETINCLLSAAAPIYTRHAGWKPVSEISVGQAVLTHERRFMPIERTLCSTLPAGADYVRLRVASAGRAIQPTKVAVTAEHNFLAADGWTAAHRLRAGRTIAVLASRCRVCNGAVPFWRSTCSSRCWSKFVLGEASTSGLAGGGGAEEPHAFVMARIIEAERLKTRKAVRLWNFSVAEDHSYIVYGLVAKNCRCSISTWHPSFESKSEDVAPIEIAVEKEGPAPGSAQEQAREYEQGIWRPQPEEIELEGAAIARTERVGHGATVPYFAIDEAGQKIAVLKPMSASWMAKEVGSYRLSRAFGIDMVPTTIERRAAIKGEDTKVAAVGFKEGQLVAKRADELKISAMRLLEDLAADEEDYAPQLHKLFAFDYITGNFDRHIENALIDPERKRIWAIDYSHAFQPDVPMLLEFVRRNLSYGARVWQGILGKNIPTGLKRTIRAIKPGQLTGILKSAGVAQGSIDSAVERLALLQDDLKTNKTWVSSAEEESLRL